MNHNKRTFVYCNDCANKNSKWKVFDKNGNNKKQPCHTLDFEYKSGCDKNPCGADLCGKKDTLISVKNPNVTLIIPEENISNAIDLSEWTNIVTNVNHIFDNVTGTYSVVESGDYQIELTINYETSVSLPVNFTLEDVPIVEIYDVCTNGHILSSHFPTVCLVIPIPPVSSGELPITIDIASLLCRGQVIINAVVPLKCGQKIRIRAVSNGLTYPFVDPPVTDPRIIFSPVGVDTTLSIYKVKN